MGSLKETIAEVISQHIALEDTYTYELTRTKSAFEVGTMSLEDFEEWTEENVADLAKAIVGVLQPQLNENQQIVLEWLKDKYTITDIEPIELFWRLHVNTKNKFRTLLAYRAYKSLTRKAQLEVLSAFAQWALEQEEE